MSSGSVPAVAVAGEAIVVDTSAWIEFLQATGSNVHLQLAEAVESETDIVVPEVVRMELLIGGTSEDWAVRRRRMLDSFHVEPAMPLVDTETAAAIQRSRLAAGLPPIKPDPWPQSTWDFLRKHAARVRDESID